MGAKWVLLDSICPLELKDFISKAKPIDDALSFSPDLNKLDEYKISLLKTKSDIEILVGELISLLQSPDLQKTIVDTILYDFLKKDLSGYMGIIDEKQEQHLESHDGEVRAGVGRTMAFRGVLRVALYGIIYGSLYDASIEYINLPDEFTIKEKRPKTTTTQTLGSVETIQDEVEIERTEIKGKNTFLRILFHVLSIKLSVLGGMERRKSSIKRYSPPTWKTSYTDSGKTKLAESYKKETGEDLTQEILKEEDLFAEDSGGGDDAQGSD